MSLAKLPIRIASVMALRDKTWASAVFDSVITPLEQKVAEGGNVCLLVAYTDDAMSRSETLVRYDMTGQCPTVHLTFHAAIASGIRTTANGQTITTARSDSAFEAALDVLSAQIVRVLQHDAGPWAELWRSFVVRIGERHERRGGVARKGSRFAAREIVIPLEVVPDPLGAGAEWPWNKAVELFGADPELSDLGHVLGAFCGDLPAMPAWRADLATVGLPAAIGSAIGLVTEDGDEVVFR